MVILDQRLWFPDPHRAPSGGSLNGLVAIGGDLSIERLLLAYRSGIFPWSVEPVSWWSPDPRGVLELDHFHVSRSLARTLRKGEFRVSVDAAFRKVMEACAASAPQRPSTWISSQFIEAYVHLHHAGHAHSVEAWLGEELVGGVYGVHIGGFFAGESMFHTASNASKVALAHVVERLRQRNFVLFDIQMVSAHTERFGAIEIPRSIYLERLARAVELPCAF